MSEPEFFSRLVERTGCRILLDVNNVYVSASNLGFDPAQYVDALPEGAVAQMHIAGHRNMGAFLLDSHDERVSQPVWDIYLHACRRFGSVSTSLEWDTHLPPLEVLREELSRAAALRSAAGIQPRSSPTTVTAPHGGRLPNDVRTDDALAHSQRALQAAILDGAGQERLPRKDGGESGLRPLSRGEGIAVYGSAYRARHVDILRFAFPVLGELMGSELKDFALDHMAAHPGPTGDLEQLTRSFAEWMCDAFRLHHWADVVRGVVALDTTLMALRRCTGTEGRVNPCLRILRLSEPSYVRNLSMRAGVAMDWSGDASEDVVIWRRGFQLHAVFLRWDQASFLGRLVDGAEPAAAAAAESIDIACAVEWISGWADAGLLYGGTAAGTAADTTASDLQA